MTHVERALRATASLFTGQAPNVGLLASHRRAAAERVLDRHHPCAIALESALAADPSDGPVREDYAQLAERALAEMRAEVRRRADQGPLTALVARADDAWRAAHLTEHLDNPAFDRAARVRLIDNLDRVNVFLGSYEGFYDALQTLIAGREGPVRILDLAAGHGGFAVWAAARARAESRDLRFTVTDIKREYLDLGRERARAADLPVTFEHLDVSDLASLERGAYDVIMCTQALHHFPPGLVALMFAGAYRAAGAGVLFVDGCRSAVHAAPFAALGYLYYRDPALVHDAVVSMRRFFSTEELGLLCRLGPWRDHVQATWRSPGHCTVTATKPR